MTPFTPNFIDKPEKNGPFEGALVIFNIGSDNYESISMPAEYEQYLCDSINDAIARGLAIIYAWDTDKGISLPPLGYEDRDDMVFTRLLADVCGIQKADFDISPSERSTVFGHMAENLLSHKEFFFTSPYVGFIGLCRIDGTDVFMPLDCP